jgi:tRNA (pseudouridine54-N1)-methyltransferase
MVRHFIYFSSKAVTSGKALASQDLMKAGRMDIAIHSFIQGVFLSHGIREDVVFHFIFYGMPDPPKHIEIQINSELEISKKDIGNLIKKILYKYKSGQKNEVFPGCFVEKKSFLNVVQELLDKGVQIFLLDEKGQDIRQTKINKNCAFIFGDQNGLPQKEMKRLKRSFQLMYVGPKTYFASQTIAVVNNELDRRNI